MVWWLFRKKSAVEKLKNEVENSLENVKNDFEKVGGWIKHFDSKSDSQDERLSTIESDLSEIKTFISFFGSRMPKQMFKQPLELTNKHTAVEGVQAPVQTLVQSTFLGNLSMNERVIVWVLLNAKMKLSCEDIASLINKDKSTIRGQLNNIKQKSENLIEEAIEKSGKKRYYIKEEVKDMLLEKAKITRTTKRIRKSKSEDF